MLDEWMDRQMSDLQIDRYINVGWMDRYIDGWMGCFQRMLDRWMDRLMGR